MAEEKKIFAGGGMDMDTEERFIAPNDYRYALNCRVSSSDEGNAGAVENVVGNRRLSLDGFPVGTSTEGMITIGSYEDKKKDRLFYFICDDNGNGNHRIVCNYTSKSRWDTICEGPFLNFDKDHLITGVNIIFDDVDFPDGLLFWTDDINPPRKLDVRRGLRFFTGNQIASSSALGLSGTYEEVDGSTIEAIAKPPTEPPFVSIGSNSDIQSNHIRSKLWQFKYRYRYITNQKSAWSPISELSMTTSNDSSIQDQTIDNYIEVKVRNSRFDVVSIDIAVRNPETGGDFYIIHTIHKNDKVQPNTLLSSTGGSLSSAVNGDVIPTFLPNWDYLYFIFNGNETKFSIPLQESNKLFDDVPQLAKAQEIVDGNRLVYGNVVNGYDPVDTDCEFDVVFQDTGSINSNTRIINYSVSHEKDECYFGFHDNKTRDSHLYQIKFHFPSNIQTNSNLLIDLRNIGVAFAFSREGNLVSSDKWSETVFDVSILNQTIQWGSTVNTMSGLLSHFKSNVPVVFNSRYYDYENSDSTIQMSAGIGKDSECIGNTHVDSAPFNSSITHSKFWSLSGNTIILSFRLYTSGDTSLIYNAPNTHGVIGFDGAGFHGTSIQGNGNPINGNTYRAHYVNELSGNASVSIPDWDLENNSLVIDPPVANLANYRGFKSGVKHNFGIVYYDGANRSGAVNKCGSVYIPLPHERDSVNKDNAASIHYKIFHDPPEWATHYQWVYSSDELEDFLQVSVNTIEFDNSIKAKYRTVLPENVDSTGSFQQIIETSGTQYGYVKMDMEELIKLSSSLKSDKQMWEWKEGDRMRIIGPSNYDGYDFEIIGIQEELSGTPKLWYILEAAANNVLTSLPLTDIHVEIYRLKESESDIFYEFNHVNRLGLNPSIGKYHKVNSFGGEDNLTPNPYIDSSGTNTPTQFSYNQHDTSNPTSGNPAEGTFKNGDIYIRERLMVSSGGTIKVEDYSFSDFFKSRAWDAGRPNAYLPDFKQARRDATIFYSEPYIPNTKINGLSEFYPDVSFQEYDKTYNSIQKLYSINDSLIIFQEDKTSKAMVSRDVLFDASGEQNVALSSNILSPSVPYVGDYGICKNPESFAQYGFRTYFFDVRRRAVLRLSQDGLTPISEHKMKNFFTDFCEDIRGRLGNFRCYGAYDTSFNEYVMVIPDIVWFVQSSFVGGQSVRMSLPGFTIGFDEKSDRWNSFYSYTSEWLASYHNDLYTFSEGIPWQHNHGETCITIPTVPPTLECTPKYNIFHDVEYDSIIDVPSNSNPTINKIYQTIAEEATNIWEVESMDTRNGQNTDVSLTDFTKGQTFAWQEGHGTKENIHHAVIMGDKNTPNMASTVEAKIEGDRMRDTSAIFRMRLPIPAAQEQNVLFSITFGFIPSGSPDLVGNQ